MTATLDGLRGSSFRDDVLQEEAVKKLRYMVDTCAKGLEQRRLGVSAEGAAKVSRKEEDSL